MTRADNIAIYAQLVAYQLRRIELASARNDVVGAVQARERAEYIFNRAAESGIDTKQVEEWAHGIIAQERREKL